MKPVEKMMYLTEQIGAVEIMDLVMQLVGVMLDQEGVDCDKTTPAGGKKCYRDTLQYHNGFVFIWYNDKSNSTKVAKVAYCL